MTARPVAAIVPTASPSTEGETLASTATPLPSGIVAPKMSGPGVEPAALQNGGANTTAVSGANAVPNSQSGSERAVVLPTEGGAAQPMGQNAPAVTASVDRPSEFAARPAPAVQASVLASQSIRVSSPRARVEAAAAPLSESSTVALSGEETGDGEGAESIPRAQSPSSGRPATPAPRPGAPPNGTAIPGGANELAARPFVANTALADVKPNAATQAGVSRGTLVQSAVEILDLPVEARVASGASASGAADPLSASVATRAEPLSTVAPATSLPVPSEGGVESPASARPTLQTLGDFAVKSVRYLNARGGETIVVRLVPESLGELRIVVKSGSDGMEIELSSRTQVVRATLESQLPALREAFARDGADVARITVTAPSAFDAASDSSLGRPSSHAGNQAPSNGNGQGRGNAPSGNGYGAEGRSRNRAPSHDGALNVFA